MAEKPAQIIYVLTNQAMPGLVKIGKATRLEVEERMKHARGHQACAKSRSGRLLSTASVNNEQ